VVVGDGAALGCGIACGTTTAPAFAALAQRKTMPAQTRLRRFTRPERSRRVVRPPS
jgi:hypothetical protein